jgi:hypothetical protein
MQDFTFMYRIQEFLAETFSTIMNIKSAIRPYLNCMLVYVKQFYVIALLFVFVSGGHGVFDTTE